MFPMKRPAQHLTAELPRRQSRVETTIGIDPGDVFFDALLITIRRNGLQSCGQEGLVLGARFL